MKLRREGEGTIAGREGSLGWIGRRRGLRFEEEDDTARESGERE